ncbi:MAG TPA: hypothetical protein VFF73_11515 [Planctomycetota bacterium]|nr:hypothetical protein [Planctomycetota bacterium]
MSDERLRELARRARKNDDPVAELRAWVEARRSGALPEPAGALVDRLSRGELDRERVALAAYAAHEGALALLDEETASYSALVGDLGAVHVALGDACTYHDLLAWIPGLRRWGEPAIRVTEIALVRALSLVNQEILDAAETVLRAGRDVRSVLETFVSTEPPLSDDEMKRAPDALLLAFLHALDEPTVLAFRGVLSPFVREFLDEIVAPETAAAATRTAVAAFALRAPSV